MPLIVWAILIAIALGIVLDARISSRRFFVVRAAPVAPATVGVVRAGVVVERVVFGLLAILGGVLILVLVHQLMAATSWPGRKTFPAGATIST